MRLTPRDLEAMVSQDGFDVVLETRLHDGAYGDVMLPLGSRVVGSYWQNASLTLVIVTPNEVQGAKNYWFSWHLPGERVPPDATYVTTVWRGGTLGGHQHLFLTPVDRILASTTSPDGGS